MAKKTRLLSRHKEMLRSHLSKCDLAPTERKIKEQAYEAAVPLMVSVHNQAFPPCDMKVLKKYDSTQTCTQMRGYAQDCGVTLFEFVNGDERAPLEPSHLVNWSSNQKTYPFSFEDYEAIHVYRTAVTNHAKVETEVFGMFRSLIHSASTLEDVMDAWPAAISVEKDIRADLSLPTLISKEVIQKIKALNVDVAVQEKSEVA